MNKFITCNCPVSKKTVPTVVIPLEVALYVFEVGNLIPQLAVVGEWDQATFVVREVSDDMRVPHNALFCSTVPRSDGTMKYDAIIFYDGSIDAEKSFTAFVAMPLPCGKARALTWAKIAIETDFYEIKTPYVIPQKWDDQLYSICASFDEREHVAECGCRIRHGIRGAKAFKMKYPNA